MTESNKTSLRTRFQLARISWFLIGLILASAAVGKGFSAETSAWLRLFGGFELLVGVALMVGFGGPALWTLVFVGWCGFLSYGIVRWFFLPQISCGCFGDFQLPPLATFTLNSAALTGTIMFRHQLRLFAPPRKNHVVVSALGIGVYLLLTIHGSWSTGRTPRGSERIEDVQALKRLAAEQQRKVGEQTLARWSPTGTQAAFLERQGKLIPVLGRYETGQESLVQLLSPVGRPELVPAGTLQREARVYTLEHNDEVPVGTGAVTLSHRACNFGVVEFSKTYSLELLINNVGHTSIGVDSTSTSCSCVQVEQPQQRVLEPGATTALQVTLRPTNSPSILQQLQLSMSDEQSNEHKAVSLPVYANIRRPFMLSPAEVTFGVVPFGKRVSRTIRLETLQGATARFVRLQTGNDNLRFDLSMPGRARLSYDGRHVGPRRGVVKVEVNCNGARHVATIPYQVSVRAPLELSPSRLAVPSARRREVVTRRVLLRADLDDYSVQVNDLPSGIDVAFDRAASPRQMTITWELNETGFIEKQIPVVFGSAAGAYRTELYCVASVTQTKEE